MGTIASLRGQTVAIDTAPFIYFIENHPVYLPVLDPLFESVSRGEIQVVTTSLTVAEVLVKPLKSARHDLVLEYTQILLSTSGIEIIEVSVPIAEEAARIRADLNCKLPDAIQLATAIHAGAGVFVTNDLALSAYSSVQVLQLNQLVDLL